MEIWKDISGYETLYMVSSYGKVKSLERIDNNNHPIKEKILTQQKDKYGYLRVTLCKNGKQKNYRVNRLVGLHFIPIPERLKNIPIDKLDVGHLKPLPDGTEDKTANEVWNLAWMSKSENDNFGTRNERIGETKKGMKLSEETKNKMKNHPNKSKIILQIDLNGNIIADFPSLCEVQRQLGYERASVSRCCLGKQKTSYGYKWEYKNG